MPPGRGQRNGRIGAHDGDGLPERVDREDGDFFHDRGFDPVGPRNDESGDASPGSLRRHREDTAHRSNAPVERQLSQKEASLEPNQRKLQAVGRDGEGHCEIEPRALLLDVGGRQVDGDSPLGEIEARILQRGSHANFGFSHRSIGEPHHAERFDPFVVVHFHPH